MQVRNVITELFEEYKKKHNAKQGASWKQQCETNVFEGRGSTLSKSTWELDFENMLSEDDGLEKTELDDYLAEKLLPNGEGFDILMWWKCNGSKFPILQKIARDILAIPISSVASESSFSMSGNKVTKQRNRIKAETVGALMCSQSWLRKELQVNHHPLSNLAPLTVSVSDHRCRHLLCSRNTFSVTGSHTLSLYLFFPLHSHHSLEITSRISSFPMRSKHSISRAQNVSSKRPLRQFVTGVVERIEYDPNRTSRTAMVRWVEGAAVDRPKKVNSLQKKLHPSPQDPTLHLHQRHDAPSSFVNVLGVPRMAMAGAKPEFFVPRMKDDVKENESLLLNEVKRWDKDSVVWGHKMKRKTIVSWGSLRQRGILGVVNESESKSKVRESEKVEKDGKFGVDRAHDRAFVCFMHSALLVFIVAHFRSPSYRFIGNSVYFCPWYLFPTRMTSQLGRSPFPTSLSALLAYGFLSHEF
ncbi:unnamed protein product [Lactuca saligna]|uniref:HAT C-terminal dimerisation domain-containing protein n=1 Tax=Lactuca saligna TaxID=75948 RepID=A0AA36E6D9_LACSI|nr:unnamed protein product [Lactuca saligna]